MQRNNQPHDDVHREPISSSMSFLHLHVFSSTTLTQRNTSRVELIRQHPTNQWCRRNKIGVGTHATQGWLPFAIIIIHIIIQVISYMFNYNKSFHLYPPSKFLDHISATIQQKLHTCDTMDIINGRRCILPGSSPRLSITGRRQPN